MNNISRPCFLSLFLFFFYSHISSYPKQDIAYLLCKYPINGEKDLSKEKIMRGNISCDQLCHLCDMGYEFKGENNNSEAICIFSGIRDFFAASCNYEDDQFAEFKKYCIQKNSLMENSENIRIRHQMLKNAKEFNSVVRECATKITEKANELERRYNIFIEESGPPRIYRRTSQQSISPTPSSPKSPQRKNGWW